MKEIILLFLCNLLCSTKAFAEGFKSTKIILWSIRRGEILEVILKLHLQKKVSLLVVIRLWSGWDKKRKRRNPTRLRLNKFLGKKKMLRSF